MKAVIKRINRIETIVVWILMAGFGVFLLLGIIATSVGWGGDELKRMWIILAVASFLALIVLGGHMHFAGLARDEVLSSKGSKKAIIKNSIFGIILIPSPTCIYALTTLSKMKAEKVEVADEEPTGTSLLFDALPNYKEGYDEDANTIIRLVSKKQLKKPYQTRNIEDVASKNNWKGWLYLAPVLILVAIFLIYPLINTIFISFTKDYVYSTGEFNGLTFHNFVYVLSLAPKSETNIVYEPYFVKYAIPNTLIITFVTVPLSTALALLISVALNSIKWFQKALQTIFFLPYVTNGIAVGMVFSVLFDSSGVINYIFGLGDKAWVHNADPAVAMIPLCIYIVWSSIPFKILIFLSGLQGIDKQYYQAAQIDSTPKWKVLTKVTIPLLSPQILYIMITSFIGAFKEYTAIVGLFNGPGTDATNGTSSSKNMLTIVYYIYENLHDQTSIAAAAAVILFIIILAFTGVQFAVSKKRVHY